MLGDKTGLRRIKERAQRYVLAVRLRAFERYGNRTESESMGWRCPQPSGRGLGPLTPLKRHITTRDSKKSSSSWPHFK